MLLSEDPGKVLSSLPKSESILPTSASYFFFFDKISPHNTGWPGFELTLPQPPKC